MPADPALNGDEMIPRKKTHQTATQGRKVRNYGTGINYGAAVEGGPIPVVMGTNQVAPTLIYFNPGPGTVEPYLGKNYACLWGLCEGVIDSVPRYWRDTKRYLGVPASAFILLARDAFKRNTGDPLTDWTSNLASWVDYGTQLPPAYQSHCLSDANYWQDNAWTYPTWHDTTRFTAPDGTANHMTYLTFNRQYTPGVPKTSTPGFWSDPVYIESPVFDWPDLVPTMINVWARNTDNSIGEYHSMDYLYCDLIDCGAGGAGPETSIERVKLMSTNAEWNKISLGALLPAGGTGNPLKLRIGSWIGDSPSELNLWPAFAVWLEGAGTEWAIHKGEVGQDVDAAISANWGDAYAVAHPPPPGAPGQQTPTPGTDSLSYSGIAYIATFDQYYNQDKPQIGNFLFEVKGPYTGTVASPRYDGDGTDANAATALEILLAAVVLP